MGRWWQNQCGVWANGVARDLKMENLRFVFDSIPVLGGLISVSGSIWGLYKWFTDSWPLFFRLSHPKTKKIAIHSNDGNEIRKIRLSLKSSGLYVEKNIQSVSFSDTVCIKDSDVHLIDWESLRLTEKPDEWIMNLLKNQRKSEKSAAIVYAPDKRLPDDLYADIAEMPNVSVCNQRGRMTNDVLVSILVADASK
jgi:hypothetical protein